MPRILIPFLAWATISAAQAATPMIDSCANHSVALRDDGRVLTWGVDFFGALGTGRVLYRSAAEPIASLSNVVQVAGRGGYHVLALTASGEVLSWGSNAVGQLGDGTITPRGSDFVRVEMPAAQSVAAGFVHSLALARDGTVWSWGANSRGELGDGTTKARSRPARVADLSDIVAIAAGLGRSVALARDGRVWTWGDGYRDGPGPPQEPLRPILVPGLAGVVAVDTMYRAAVALKADGTVWGWGRNGSGELGIGNGLEIWPAIAIPGLADVSAVSLGFAHGLALKRDGAVWAWGSNLHAALGNTFLAATQAPSPVAGLGEVTAVSAGLAHSLALTRAGAVFGWGGNFSGALAVSPDQSLFITTPTRLAGLDQVQAINAGHELSLALRAGNVLAWGSNTQYQLASQVAEPLETTTPFLVPSIEGVEFVACGNDATFAVRSDGSVWAWGSNDYDQLGTGLAGNASAPTRVSLSVPVVSVAANKFIDIDDTVVAPIIPGASSRGFAVDREGGVWSWGGNRFGELGYSTPAAPGRFAYEPLPKRIPGLQGIVEIAAGSHHTLARDSAGRLWTWGDGSLGQLGNGGTLGRAVPAQVAVGGAVTSISAGRYDSLAVVGGNLYHWGLSLHDGVGSSDAGAVLSPVALPALRGIRMVSRGYVHALAATLEGDVLAWGRGSSGALGDGTTRLAASTTPARLHRHGRITDVSGGVYTSMALADLGGVLGWGDNTGGQVGDGTLADRLSPQLVLGVGGAGFLDLSPATPPGLGTELAPVFKVVASGSASGEIASVTADVQPRSPDVGSTASTFVFALAPATLVQGAAAMNESRVAWKAAGSSKDVPIQCALAQLNAQGQLVAVSAASLQAYASGVLSAQGQSVKVLNGVSSAALAGATFYVGYGPNGNAMLLNGTTRSVVSVPASVSCQPRPPQTGWWYNPAEGGRGFSIEARGNRLFMAAFHYDAAGRPTWNFSGGATSLDGSLFTSEFLGASGGQTLTGAYRLPGLNVVGPITLAFSDDTHGTLFWPGGSVAIERQPFVPNGLTAPAQANQPESGWWWNPAESGRGFFIEWQNGYADLAGYMYDDAGNPTWYISVFPTPNPMAFNGAWWSFSGGQSMGGPYRPATRTSDNVGSVAIEFATPTTATMTLPDGRRIPLVRQAF